VENLSVAELIRQGSAAARAGNAEAARRYFRLAIDAEASNTEAWLGLCGVLEGKSEKRDCFRRVLAVDPANAEAQDGLRWLDNPPAPMPAPILATPAQVQPDVMYCANHPNVETVLRCNRCGKPICTKCAIQTPVGFRCPECVYQQQSVYYTARTADYPIAATIVFVLSVIGGIFVPALAGIVGLLYGAILMIFIAPAIGGVLAEAVRRVAGKRRGRYMRYVIPGAAILGTGLGFLVSLGLGILVPWLRPNFLVALVYAALLVSTLYARTR
jgi:hypothetical protein